MATRRCDASWQIALKYHKAPLHWWYKSTPNYIMAWCFQVTTHYLNQCWSRSMCPHGVTRPKWVKSSAIISTLSCDVTLMNDLRVSSWLHKQQPKHSKIWQLHILYCYVMYNSSEINFIKSEVNHHEYTRPDTAATDLFTYDVYLPSLRHSRTLLHWRHNEHDGVSNHRRLDCLLHRLFKPRSKKTSKLCVIGLCDGNSPHKGPVTRKMFPCHDVIIRAITTTVWNGQGELSSISKFQRNLNQHTL